MQVLVLNPGSSTLKYRLVEVGAEPRVLASGLVDRISGERVSQAGAEVVKRCRDQGIDAVGCRVVHGGDRFSEPTLVTSEVLHTIRELGRLAPLHNPIAATVLQSVGSALPGVPVVAVFDTAFHRTIPEVAALYAIPLELSRSQALRRYGFHGTSHRYVIGRLAHHLGERGRRLISCHLGNGASITAVRDGKSVDTSMGLTPLEGLMMGTRSGDIDPGLLLHLLRAEGMGAEELEGLLNQKSGLLGVGGHPDLRELEKAGASGDECARLAMEMFAYRVRKYIGAYAAVLEGVDGIAFTGGIGEHGAVMRERILRPLAWLGVVLDEGANQLESNKERRVTGEKSPVQAWVIPTDEEGLIAREVEKMLRERKVS